MKKTLMIATSALALTLSVPAMAESTHGNNPDQPHVETTTKAEIEANWDATKDTASKAWNNTTDAVSDAADSVADTTTKAYKETVALLDTKTDIDTYVESDARTTTSDIIGASIYTPSGDKLANIQDLIIDDNGTVQGYVVSYGGFMGIGSRDVVVQANALSPYMMDSDYHTSLMESDMDSLMTFDKQALAASNHLASDLNDSAIVNPNMDELAEVDDIVIENGAATKLIVSSGLMNNPAMIDYTDADIVYNQNNDVEFKLSMNESEQFKSFMAN